MKFMFFPVMKSIITSGRGIRYHIDDASNNNKLLCLASIESMTKPKKIYPQWILRFKQGLSYQNDFELIRYRNKISYRCSCFTYPDARHYFVYFKLLSTIFSKRQLRIASKILAITRRKSIS